MAGIKSVLNKASGYSDSGASSDAPPTPQDFAMRIKHTTDSVHYNMEHAEDHLAEMVAQLGKLAGANHQMANELVKKIETMLYGFCDEVKQYKVEM